MYIEGGAGKFVTGTCDVKHGIVNIGLDCCTICCLLTILPLPVTFLFSLLLVKFLQFAISDWL